MVLCRRTDMLKQRVVTAIVLLVAFLAALFLLPANGWIVLVALVAGIGAWEWGALAGFAAVQRRVFVVVVTALCVALGALLPTTALLPVYALSALFWLLVVPLWLRAHWRSAGLLAGWCVGLVLLLPTALAMMHLRGIGAWVLLGAMALVWIADIAAYFTGRAFGRHKLAPSVSPGKTWEGAAGAVAGVVVYGVALASGGAMQLTGAAAWAGLLVALLLLTAISIVGDLFESLMKRQAGVKDSGTILPGHGGMLDRIDSLTSTLPLVGLFALVLRQAA